MVNTLSGLFTGMGIWLEGIDKDALKKLWKDAEYVWRGYQIIDFMTIWYKKSLHQKILEMTIKFEKISLKNL